MASLPETDFPYIAESLRPLAFPIENLIPLEGNPRRGKIEAIKGILTEFGFQTVVTVQRSTGEIIIGNHRVKAAIELGWTHVPVNFVDLPENEAKALAAADNRASELGHTDDAALRAFLDGVDESLLTAASIDSKMINSMVGDLGSKIEKDDFTKPKKATKPKAASVRLGQIVTFKVEPEEWEAFAGELFENHGDDEEVLATEIRRRLGIFEDS